MRAKDIMTVNIVTVSGETSAKHASPVVTESVRGAVDVQITFVSFRRMAMCAKERRPQIKQ